MNIVNTGFKFKNTPSTRKSTKYIILHHRAGNGDAESIHKTHLNNGWSGIGYHFYVRKDGSVYQGRPINASGAHTTDYNSVSVGVCFEGNFENEKMSYKQLQAGRNLIAYLKEKYPSAQIKKHRDFNATACPGRYFPFGELLIFKKELTTVNDIVWELNHRGIISDKQLWLEKLTPNSNAYHLAYKAANMTVNKDKPLNLNTVNDIVWELNSRKIMTDKTLWMKLLNEDMNLYWLALKICNQTKNK